MRRLLSLLAIGAAASCVALWLAMGPLHVGPGISEVHVFAAPQACAQSPGLFVPPTAFDPQMVVVSQFGNDGAVTHSAVGRSHAVGGLGFLWFEAVNEQVQGLPVDFGARNPSSLVNAEPFRVLQVVETVQTLSTVADAHRFVAMFEPGQTTSAQVPISGGLVGVRSTGSVLEMGDDALLVERPSPAAGYPSSTQYIVRRGTTVVTLELIGGSGLTDARARNLAINALTRVETTCGI